MEISDESEKSRFRRNLETFLAWTETSGRIGQLRGSLSEFALTPVGGVVSHSTAMVHWEKILEIGFQPSVAPTSLLGKATYFFFEPHDSAEAAPEFAKAYFSGYSVWADESAIATCDGCVVTGDLACRNALDVREDALMSDLKSRLQHETLLLQSQFLSDERVRPGDKVFRAEWWRDLIPWCLLPRALGEAEGILVNFVPSKGPLEGTLLKIFGDFWPREAEGFKISAEIRTGNSAWTTL